ncbi:protein of unknown function [Trichlorobacter ammonificans]|uniref:Uncharacterized protein n=1 Tax=Trichlorobacter ammonificans TaxID=2916410 RepID=A0ABM9D668_9BACT|nr:protein of unknown function [Trichlorobacter ammonificans]
MGRALLGGLAGDRTGSNVSIHARPLGRALRFEFWIVVKPVIVSIHARPLGRALPGGVVEHDRQVNVSIHARPLGRALAKASVIR